MRRILRGCLLLWLALWVVGCGGTGEHNWPTGNFSVWREGAYWAVPYAWFQVSGDTLHIRAYQSTSSDAARVEMVLPGAEAGKTYTLTAPSLTTAWARYVPDGDTDHAYTTYASSGSVKIDSLSVVACSGSFSFVGRNAEGVTITMTNGTFTVPEGSAP